MNPELEQLIAAWQVDVIDELELARLEALLLASEEARQIFARRCQEDVALRQVCTMATSGPRPGAETQRLMRQDTGNASSILELDELIAAWQVDAIDEAGARRLETLLLASEEARRIFAGRCQEDVVLRQVCRIATSGTRPGAETQRLMKQGSAPISSLKPRRSSGRLATAGPNRRSGRRAVQGRSRRSRPQTPAGLRLGITGGVLAMVLILVIAIQPSHRVSPTPPAPAPTPAPRELAVLPPTPAPAPVTIATLRELQGSAEHQRAGLRQAARPRQALASGDHLRLTADSRAVLTLADDTRFTVAGGSQVQVFAGRSGFILALDRGDLAAAVAHQDAERQVIIRTPHGLVTVVGTAFSVESAGPRTRVAVDEGLVEARAQGGDRQMVGAGQSVIIEDGRVRYEVDEVPAIATLPPVEPALPAVPEPQPLSGGMVSFSLLDAITNTDVPGYDPVSEGMTIDRRALGLNGISLRGNFRGPVLSARFWIDGEASGRLEKFLPFTLRGDRESDYEPWRPVPGSYLIEAQGYSDLTGSQPLGQRIALRIQVR